MTRPRIDYMPGPAAIEALEVAATLLPHLGRQALIDRLVVTGLAALRQPPLPALHGTDRDAWRLPAELRLHSGVPGKRGVVVGPHLGEPVEPSREGLPIVGVQAKVAMP